MAWSSSHFGGDWNPLEAPYPEMDTSLYTDQLEATSPAILRTSHFHTHPHCNTCLQGLNNTSTTANPPAQNDFPGINTNSAAIQTGLTSHREVPGSSLQTTPRPEEVYMPQPKYNKASERKSSREEREKVSDSLLPFVCEWKNCKRPRPFADEGTLMRHIKTEHVNRRKIECPFPWCSKDFKRKDRLDDHVYRVHRSQG